MQAWKLTSLFLTAVLLSCPLLAASKDAEGARVSTIDLEGRRGDRDRSERENIVQERNERSPQPADSKKDEPRRPDVMSPGTFAGLKLRSIGPALNSGRVVAIAVDPTNFDRYYVGVASGGVWKTTNNGTTFQPVFDNE